MKTIAITGASGFVGTSLTKYFSNLGYKIIAISRDILNNQEKLKDTLNQTDIVINLAGANIINRWSDSYKKLLYSSRIDTTSKIVNAINSVQNKPKLLISTSAVGIYDNKSTYAENGSFSNDFLSTLCQNWENEA